MLASPMASLRPGIERRVPQRWGANAHLCRRHQTLKILCEKAGISAVAAVSSPSAFISNRLGMRDTAATRTGFTQIVKPSIALSLAVILLCVAIPSAHGETPPQQLSIPSAESQATSLLTQGIAAYKAGQLDVAEQNLEAALRRNPKLAEAHAYLGLTLARAGNLKAALAELHQAYQLDSANPDYAYDYAVSLIKAGDYRAAVPILQSLRNKSPESQDVFINLARAYIGAKQFSQLSRLASQLPPNCDDNFLKTLAGTLASAKEFDAMEQMWQTTIQRDPNRPLPYAALAELWAQQGKARQGLALLHHAPESARGPVFWYAYGQVQISLHDYDGAAQTFARLVQNLPTNERAWAELIRAQMMGGHFAEAGKHAEEATRRFPGVVEFQYQRAVADYLLGRNTEALHALQSVLKEPGISDPRPILLAAVLESESGRYDEALRTFARLPHDPGNCNALGSYFYGATLLRAHRLPEAASELRMALRCRPHFALAEYRLGQALLGMNQLQEASAALERAAHDDPKLAEPYYALAQVRRRMGDERGAREALERFSRLHQHVKASDRALLQPYVQ
jgi:predicted Zn-dependent protease